MGTKYHGYQDLLAPFVAEACMAVMPNKPKKADINIDSVRVCKLLGGTISDTKVVNGFVLQRDSEGVIKRQEKAKIAVFGCGLEAVCTILLFMFFFVFRSIYLRFEVAFAFSGKCGFSPHL